MGSWKVKEKSFVLGEFRDTAALLAAGRALREAGLGRLDAYSPYPVHGIEEALALPRSIVPRIALGGGLAGLCGGYLLQYWCNVIDYPLNVGGRPLHGWPSNIPITFESGILLTALSIFFGSLYLFGLPRPYHPVFESEQFRSASLDAFWISAEADDEEQAAGLEEKLRQAGAGRVHTVVEAV
jgi:hypothetical protein